MDNLRRMLITHQDIDHIGSAAALLDVAPNAVEVLAYPIERPYIEGERHLLKLTPDAIAQAVAALPPGLPEGLRAKFQAVLENPPTVRVDQPINGGDEIPHYGGLEVIDTPGHTPGHISLYHRPSKTLIAGDCLVAQDGALQPPDPGACHDYALTLRSLHNLVSYDIEAVICFHGGL